MARRGRGRKTARRGGGSSGRRDVEEEEYYDDEEDAGPRVGTLRPEGLSLPVKFAIVIAAVSAVLVVMVGTIIYFQVRTALDREINRRGIDLVRQLRGRCSEYINKGKIELARYKAELEALKVAMGGQQGAARNVLVQRYNARVKKWKEIEEPALKGEMADYLKNIVFIDKESGKHAKHMVDAICNTSRYPGPVGAKPERDNIESPREIENEDGIRVVSGVTKGRPVRVFTTAIPGGEGENELAMIVLSAEQINKSRASLLQVIVLATIMAIVIGGFISYVLASQVTNPVRRLVEDIELVAAGDLEHRTLPTSKDEIGILAKTFDIMTQKICLAHDQEMQHQAREHELNIATEIQSNLLPKKIPALQGYDLGAFYRPSKEVGGDYYDFIQIDDDNIGIIVADVAGKGIPGSMVMTMARSLIRMESVRNLSPADIFVKTNRVIAQDIKRGMFVTAMYVIINTRTRALTVASAGHNPMVLFRARTGKCSLINPKGIALGFDKGPIFERTITEEKVKLEKGDRVVLYTDGVPEAMSPDQEEFGEKRFYRLVQDNGSKNSNQFVNLLVGTLEEWRGGGEQSDDITICTFRLLDS